MILIINKLLKFFHFYPLSKGSIRYIDLGKVGGAEISAEHELTMHLNLKTPIITTFCAKKPTLTMTGNYKINKYLYPDKIPENVDIARIYYQREGAGSLYVDENIPFMHLHIKEKDLPKNIQKICFASIARVLREYNIFATINPRKQGSNDLVIKENGLYKKVAGDWRYSYKKGWVTYGITLFFKPNFGIMRQVFKMDTAKMREKEVTRIEDAVIGVGENLNQDEIIKKIIGLIVDRLGYNLVVSEFTSEERQVMNSIVPLLSSENWIKNAKR
ncbi:MAG: lipoyl protein ligase domain-containing protein [Candidatus Heimdallarchaeaceae archaeon]